MRLLMTRLDDLCDPQSFACTQVVDRPVAVAVAVVVVDTAVQTAHPLYSYNHQLASTRSLSMFNRNKDPEASPRTGMGFFKGLSSRSSLGSTKEASLSASSIPEAPPSPVKPKTESPLTKPKSAVEIRLYEAVQARSYRHRSPDLVTLAAEFERMRKQLRSLVTYTQAYHDKVKAMHQAQSDVSKAIKRG
jgi:hypothetical protein